MRCALTGRQLCHRRIDEDSECPATSPLPPSRLPQLHGATTATGSQLHVKYDAQGDAKARLLCTSGAGAWPARRWQESEVALSQKHAMVTIPDEVTAWFVNAIDDRGAIASSRLSQRYFTVGHSR